jgi:hypothetical protein
MVAMLSILL